MQYDVTHGIICIPIKLNVSTKNTVAKILPENLHCGFKRSLQCNQEIPDKISCHRRPKENAKGHSSRRMGCNDG